VGLSNFQKFFSSIYFGRIVRNAVMLFLFSLVVGFPTTVLFALLLNEVAQKWFKRMVQTISYFPYFVSAVVMVGIVRMMLSPDTTVGVVNMIRKSLGYEDAINFLAQPELFRPIYVLMNIWQGTGFGAIIYLAALANVDVQQYEAAIIDGASRLQLVWHITIPALVPTMVILLILSVSGILRTSLERILLLYNPTIYETADVIETFVYRRGILGEGGSRPDYGYATAVGLFQSAVGMILIICTNWLAKTRTEQSLW
jgi:putative aldouronate transport system permease protein